MKLTSLIENGNGDSKGSGIKYTITDRTDRNNQVTKSYVSDLSLQDLIKEIEGGNPEVWHRSDFGQRMVRMGDVSHWVSGRWMAGKRFVLNIESDSLSLFGQETKPMEFFTALHARLWAAIDKEFSPDEIPYLSIGISRDPNDERLVAYNRSSESIS